MKAALDSGANFWNAGEFYGTPDPTLNLKLIARYFDKYPADANKVFLSVKGGSNLETLHPDGSPEGLRRSVENCNRLLRGTKKMDLFECARVDSEVPIETTIKTLSELIEEGQFQYIGMTAFEFLVPGLTR